ncbi:MAG: aspartate kinase [Candidatus Eiseniibacteriota bacterium]|nr:MAG: aspartate kinase [Candidatus Eisenbacteria bacterium]
MELVVQKYGGSSLATVEQIIRVAERVVEAKARGTDLIVVVSAMGNTTSELFDLATTISKNPASRELDMLLTAGERISMALLSMAINDRGCHAISFTGSQSGIITDCQHTRARIVDVKASRITEELVRNRVVIVAGFQGVSSTKEVTTLGRGGSDTTAVALASAFRAKECEIYTDVAGVFSADPRVVPDARKLDSISYVEMLELAASGAGVVHHSAVELAYRFGIPLHVRSSFSRERGTMVTSSPEKDQKCVKGIAHAVGMVLARLHGLEKTPEATGSLFRRLEESGVEVRLFNESSLPSQEGVFVLVVPEADGARVEEVCGSLLRNQAGTMELVPDVGLVTVVGSNLLWTACTCSDAFSTLASAGIEPLAASCSAITLSFLVPAEKTEQAVRQLHRTFVVEGSTASL